jgi:HCOMODA/2-hydroxy-3-carboxy-muconic semialdehyde decarboxylase
MSTTTSPSTLDALLDDLVLANRILADHHVVDAFGHVSVRHPERPDRYFMSRSRGPNLVERDDLIEFDLESRPIDQNGRRMYAERQIHGRIYAARADVHAVCHNHAPATIPFGATGTRLQPIFHMAAVIGGDIPIWDIHDDFGDTNLLVTTQPQGDSLARALAGNHVVLMRGHGSAVAGATLRGVVFAAVYLQKNAELVLEAKRLGDVRYLTPGEIVEAGATLSEALSQDRAWESWSSRVAQPAVVR